MIEQIWNAVRRGRSAEVQRQVQAFAQAADEISESKKRLDEALSRLHNQDQFRNFAEGARKLHL